MNCQKMKTAIEIFQASAWRKLYDKGNKTRGMDFKRVRALEYYAGVQIGLAVIYSPDMANLAFGRRYYCSEAMEAVFNKLNDKLSDLTLPTKCREKIKVIAMNIVQEIVAWRKSHSNILSPSERAMTSLCWTCLGTIDKLKTASKLANGVDFDVASRFRLACEYCLFDDACTIWDGMSEELKRKSSNDTFLGRWIHQEYDGDRCLESFMCWIEPHIGKCKENDLRFILREKAPSERKNILLTAILKDDKTRDFRLFCFQKMDDIAQEFILAKIPLEILKCFLMWPFQNCFLDVADRVWTLISPQGFCDVIDAILSKIFAFLCRNFEFVEILQQFWQRSPAHFKEHVNHRTFSKALRILLNCNSLETLNVNKLEAAVKNVPLIYVLVDP